MLITVNMYDRVVLWDVGAKGGETDTRSVCIRAALYRRLAPGKRADARPRVRVKPALQVKQPCRISAWEN